MDDAALILDQWLSGPIFTAASIGGNVVGPNVFVELTFQDIFVDDCESLLLSNTNLQDDVISQLEYGDFLEFVCVEQGGCVDGFSYDTSTTSSNRYF